MKPLNDSKHFYIYGESHTAYTDAEFHLKVIEMIKFMSKNIGTDFFVNDATNYLQKNNFDDLVLYIINYKNEHSDLLGNSV